MSCSSDEEVNYEEGAGQSSGATQKNGQRPGSNSIVERSLDGRRDQSIGGGTGGAKGLKPPNISDLFSHFD